LPGPSGALSRNYNKEQLVNIPKIHPGLDPLTKKGAVYTMLCERPRSVVYIARAMRISEKAADALIGDLLYRHDVRIIKHPATEYSEGLRYGVAE
jgi:hypothetical protein